MHLTTERLHLRHATMDDVPAMHAILSDPRAMAYWSTLPHATVEQTRDWVKATVDNPPSAGEDFIVELNGRIVGKVGLYRFPEIGFIFHPDVWGRGIAREALSAVLDHAVAVHGLDTVRADVDPRNAASLGLLRRLGFRETHRAERTWLIGEQWCDSIYLALHRSDWAGAQESRQG